MNLKISGVGKLVEDQRKALGLTQRQLAERVGIRSSAQISGLERDQFEMISDEKLRDILAELNLTEIAERMSLQSGRVVMCLSANCPGTGFRNIGRQIIATPAFFVTSEEGVVCPLCASTLIGHCPNENCRKPLKYGSKCLSCREDFIKDLEDRFWTITGLNDPNGSAKKIPASVDDVRTQIALLATERESVINALRVTGSLSGIPGSPSLRLMPVSEERSDRMKSSA